MNDQILHINNEMLDITFSHLRPLFKILQSRCKIPLNLRLVKALAECIS